MHIWPIFVYVQIVWWYTEFCGSQLFATTPSVANNPSNIAQWLAYASVALDVSPFAGQFVQATSLTVGYSLLLSVSKFESFGATDAWGIEKQGNITQDPKTAYILTTTVQLRSGCGRLGTMVAPGNSALKAMHNGEWHHHQLYLWDKKRHEWSWDMVSGHILTKIWQVSCSVDTSCVSIDMFLSLDSWLSSPTWLPRGHVRLPPSRRSPWGIDLVPGSHVIMSCHGPNIYLPKVEKNEQKPCWIQIQLSNSKRKDNKNNSRQGQVTSATVAFGAACEAFASCCQSEALPSAKTLIGF